MDQAADDSRSSDGPHSIWPKPQRAKQIVAIVAYFDESGTHDGSEVMTFAGYAAEEDQWIRFCVDWSALLREFGLTHCHMADLENFKLIKDFEGWDLTKKHEFLRRAIGLIHCRVRKGFSYSINVSDYTAVIAGKYDHLLGNMYTFCVGGVLREIEYWADEFKVDHIAYVFEQGAELSNQIPDLMEMASNEDNLSRFRVSNRSFFEKKQMFPLQAADILAYETRKHWLNKEVSVNKRPTRKTATMLIRSFDRVVWVERKSMETMISMLTETGE